MTELSLFPLFYMPFCIQPQLSVTTREERQCFCFAVESYVWFLKESLLEGHHMLMCMSIQSGQFKFSEIRHLRYNTVSEIRQKSSSSCCLSHFRINASDWMCKESVHHWRGWQVGCLKRRDQEHICDPKPYHLGTVPDKYYLPNE